MDLFTLYTNLIKVGEVAALLSLIIAGVKFLLSMGVPERIEDAKNQALASLLGLLIITFLPSILHFINPNLPKDIRKIFNPPPPPEKVRPGEIPLLDIPGVYAITTDGKRHLLGISCAEFGPELNNKIDTVIFNDPHNAWWGIVLFEEPGFKGPCLDLSPWSPAINEKILQSVEASSGFIYILPVGSFPEGQLTFYRRAFYDDKGGIFKARAIADNIWNDLENFEFYYVPEEELKCLKWDEEGRCAQRERPTLAGENITSIEIKGDISILLVSEGKVGGELGHNYCQLFWDQEGTFSVANLKNEYIRTNKRYPRLIKILPGKP